MVFPIVFAGSESHDILKEMCRELDDLEAFLDDCERQQKEEKEKLQESKVVQASYRSSWLASWLISS